jgi:alginate O-acetyltransferase complex protein AlgI
MLFNSLSFCIFFPIVTILYFLIPHKFRWFLLLLASCIFYMAFIPIYILILFLTIIVDYAAGIYIEKTEGHKKKIFLIVSLVVTLAILFVFKYFNFFILNFEHIAKILHWNYSLKLLNIILPIGLSFHTFQSMSYVIEVYRGNQKAEKNFGIYALYVMFYPQLVAGPIERPQNLLHQFYEEHKFEYQRVTDGLKLMAWGMFKKVVIADRLAAIVNPVYTQAHDQTGLALFIATVFFAFQIYCDFSGYSDIAIGSAQVMGFKLMDNFNRPYFSKSISEFWKRWHISLSTWFKDYLYISLGGNRVSKPRWYFNLFITFLLSGLWHGANGTFVVWGALNGFYLVFSLWTQNIRNKIAHFFRLDKFIILHKYIKILITFALTCIAWVFFRAENIKDAFYILSSIFKTWMVIFVVIIKNKITVVGSICRSTLDVIKMNDLIFAITLICFMEFVHIIQRHGSIRHMLREKPAVLRWSIYYLIVLGIIFFGVFNKSQFIYFQF